MSSICVSLLTKNETSMFKPSIRGAQTPKYINIYVNFDNMSNDVRQYLISGTNEIVNDFLLDVHKVKNKTTNFPLPRTQCFKRKKLFFLEKRTFFFVLNFPSELGFRGVFTPYARRIRVVPRLSNKSETNPNSTLYGTVRTGLFSAL